jgi:formylglycine-generating enzyme required for sulfatase activity
VDEFRRMLQLSGLGDEDEMTDDQRDAFCNMGENLGLTGGQAEDIIDEYLEQMTMKGAAALPPKKMIGRPPVPLKGKPPGSTSLPPEIAIPQAERATHARPLPPVPTPAPQRVQERRVVQELGINPTPLARASEKEKNPAYRNSVNAEMLLVTSGIFMMGSDAAEASPNEKPATRTSVSCFYLSRFLITNSQYEKFDRFHSEKRAPSADDNHPVVYVSNRDAVKFCEWLSKTEGKLYRLPTEAEWEYAARGLDNRSYPWGEVLNRGDLANFADCNTSFAWSDAVIDDGYAQTSPVGNYPLGASPFGMEDMSGNVWEWCQDYFELYKGKPRANPKGPSTGVLRVYRGGSWKSRAHSLRATCRSYNQSEFSSNDVGFRIVCEC